MRKFLTLTLSLVALLAMQVGLVRGQVVSPSDADPNANNNASEATTNEEPFQDLNPFSSSLVTIESRFLTVSDNFLEQIGVDFRGVGGEVIAPLGDQPPIGAGGGANLDFEFSPLRLYQTPGGRSAAISPFVNLGAYGGSSNEMVQFNQLGGANKASTGVFGLKIGSGLRWRIGMGERANFTLFGAGHYGYQWAGMDYQTYDPSKYQIPVSQFTDDDGYFGWSAGGGPEWLIGDCIMRTEVYFKSGTSQLFTGNDQTRSMLGVRVMKIFR